MMKNSDSDSSTHFKHLVDIAWRRKWWVIVPTVLATATSVVLVGLTPKVYRAETTILVTRQGVPEDLARSSVTLRIEERMRTLELQIFSRSYLEQIARKFAMVPADAGEAQIEAACRKLRAQVIPELDMQNFSWFRISVDDVDPKRAADIANELADLFIGKSSGMRESQATGTLETTEGWEQRYRLELAKRDEEISKFKQQNLHELPDQQPANMQLLYDAQNSVAKLTGAIQSNNSRLVALRAQQDAYRLIAAGPAPPTPAVSSENARLATLQSELEQLLASYTEANPLVKRKHAEIAELARALQAAAPTETAATSAAAAAPDPISAQIATIEYEVETLERDRTQENGKIDTYRARIGNAPRLQPRFLELTRDSEVAKRELETAVMQNEQARHAQDLEESKTGDQFHVQDRAEPPRVPYKPNVLQWVMVGIGLGLALGVGAAATREFADQTLRSEDEFAAVFPDMHVYGVIPSLDIGLRPVVRNQGWARGKLA